MTEHRGCRRVGASFALLVALFSLPGAAADEDLSPGAVRVHLHTHAFTNHNSTRFPASVQWQTAGIAALPGDDFLWWTEHVEVFRLHERYDLPLHGLRYDREEGWLGANVAGPKTPNQSRGWRVEASEGVTIESSREGVRVRLGPGSGSDPERLRLTPMGGRGRIHLMDFARPLAMGTGMEFWYRDLDLPEGATIAVTCTLSAHADPDPWIPVLRFRTGGSGGGDAPRSALAPDGRSVDTELPSPAPPDAYFVDFESAARLLPDGTDNTIGNVSITWENRSAEPLEFFLARAAIASRRREGEALRTTLLDLHRRYEGRYALPQAFSCEYRFDPPSTHRCAFLPEETPAAWFDHHRTEPEGEWIARVHEAGGIVSLCHLLGTRPELGAGGDVRDALREEVFREVRDSRANGGDLLEVGYRDRGRSGVDDYLLLWDALTASGVDLTGIGVTDSHGDLPMEGFNPWATWVYGEPTIPSILDGLLRRRCYVADFSAWDGLLDLATREGVMGDRLPLSPASTELFVRLEPAAPDLEVRLTLFPLGQALETTADLVYTIEDGPFPANTWTPLDLPGPCALRASVHRRNPDGTTLLVALTNPILYEGR